MSETCIFCRIAAGGIPATKLFETDEVVAFRDIDPKAPVHVLVIPKRHIGSTRELEPGDALLAGNLVLAATRAAVEEGIDADGYRLVMNTGANGGQSVDHIHVHVLGGRNMRWPPG